MAEMGLVLIFMKANRTEPIYSYLNFQTEAYKKLRNILKYQFSMGSVRIFFEPNRTESISSLIDGNHFNLCLCFTRIGESTTHILVRRELQAISNPDSTRNKSSSDRKLYCFSDPGSS